MSRPGRVAFRCVLAPAGPGIEATLWEDKDVGARDVLPMMRREYEGVLELSDWW
jgi:hypothetical protein